ncbi:hypothetical protein [Roseovarius sp.]|uniref:hypothetical protein n=1 Tax=Roseovarius sp. TaxID=1486281 RepID=UPI0035695505
MAPQLTQTSGLDLQPRDTPEHHFDTDQFAYVILWRRSGAVTPTARYFRRISRRGFERVTRDIMDEDMTEMVRNNLADVVYNTVAQAFFQGMVKMFQNDNEIRNIVMTDRDAREQATRHFFQRAQRAAREG